MYKKVFLVSFLVLIIDELTKILVDNFLYVGESIKVINNFFYIMRTSNTGAAFSILEGKTILLLLVALVTIYYLIKYIKDFRESTRIIITFGLIIGGILGNFYDRLVFGYVRDFLKFIIFGYNYPIFNVAEIGRAHV